MSKRFLISILGLTIVSFLAVKSVSASLNDVGAKHNFSNSSIYSSHGQGEICQICHVPHSAGSTVVPLWRGALSSTNNTYLPYKSDTFNLAPDKPTAPSIACLTCHDGSIAKGPVTGCGSCHGGSDFNLSNDHPISFAYDRTNPGLNDPSTGDIATLKMLYGSNQRVECTSCHDIHETKGASSHNNNNTADGQSHLLLVDNHQSKLCLTCHKK
jgi:hypothetical protein